MKNSTSQITRINSSGSRLSFTNWSLRTKLVSAFLIVTLVPIAIISYLNYRNTTETLVQAANVKIAGAAQVTANEVDSFFSNTLNTTRVKAQDPAIVNYLLLPAYQKVGSVEEATLNRLLDAYHHEDQLFINSVEIIDIRGKSLLDTLPEEIGVNKSSRIYFQQPMQTGLPYSSEVTFSEVTREPSLYFTAPVRNPVDSKIIGVLSIQYDASILQTIIAKNAGLAGIDSLPVLLDENHIRLAHGTLPELNYKTLVPLSTDKLAQLQAENRLPVATVEQLSTNLPEFEAGVNNLAKQTFFIAELHEAGQGTEEATAIELESHPWLLVFGQTRSVFLEPIQTQTRNSLMIALTLALVVAGFGFFIAQSLAGPVSRLTTVANQIASGDLQAVAKVETSDEIGTLARTFNTMTTQLRDFITSLEQRVQERTQALSSVAEVATAASTVLDTDKLLQQVVDLAKERFNLYHAHIYLLNEAGDALVLSSGAGEVGRQMVAEGRSIPLDREQSLVARAAREKKGVTVNDVTIAPDFLPNPLLPDTHSEMAVPMMIGDQVIGVFDVQSEVVGRFTDADIAVQTTLASQIAAAVQNARSYTKVREAEQLTRTIIDSTSDAIFIKDRQHRYALVNDGYSNSFHMPASELIGKDDLELGFPEELVRGNPEKGIRGFWTDDNLVFETGKTQHYPNDPVSVDGVIHIMDTLKIPLRNATDEIWGVLGFSRDVTEREHLHELTVQRARQQEAINLITQKIQSAITVEEALQVAAREVGHMLGGRETIVSIEPPALAIDSNKN